MSFRLYESAWVRVDGVAEAVKVRRDRKNMAAFLVGGFAYDIDARPLALSSGAPAILSIMDIDAVKKAGLHTTYDADIDPDGRA